MQLPEVLHERLARELRFAADQMQQEDNYSRKLYFFSAIHSEIGRVLNWMWSRELVLIHNVLQDTHQRISSRLGAISVGQERIIRLPEMVFELLDKAANDVAEYVEQHGEDKDLCELLGRFAELGYATTGNGYYLIEKGLIKL